MCGICGATAGGRERVARMNAAMVHRGPDDGGVYADPGSGAALGARRLSIIDVEGGHQPLANEDGSVWAVLNGEIYNHPSLQRHLRQGGHALRTGTDTEVLVHLYEDYGEGLAAALEGMYAFAIWDTRRRRLVLGRDRFGEKPLFWHQDDGGLVFASELTALRRGLDRELTIDPAAIDQFLTLGYVVGPATVYAEARDVRPGHVMVFEQETGRVTQRRYWEMPAPPPATPDSPRQLAAEFLELMRASVRSRLIADVPLGVLLSGGVDSTLVAALSAEAASVPLRTFSVGYSVGTVSETGFARDAARLIGSRHEEVVMDGADVAERAPRVLRALDQPLADQALVAMHCVSELAVRSVKVVVGGEGADELFGGYPRYRWFDRLERLRRMPLGEAAMALAAGSRGEATRARVEGVLNATGPAGRVAAWVAQARLAERDAMLGERLRELEGGRPRAADAIGGGLAGPEPTAKNAIPGASAALAAIPGDEDAPGGWAAAAMWWDVRRWLVDDILAKADRASMLCSLEMRTPYLSRELAELAASLPTAFHLRGKWLVREALRTVLPELPQRPKTAFRVPSAEWLRGPLRPTAEAVGEGPLITGGWIDGGWYRNRLAAHAAGEDHSQALWTALTLGLWLEGRCGSS
jgi:asparagine synthase (glutamine-hydrolysing)